MKFNYKIVLLITIIAAVSGDHNKFENALLKVIQKWKEGKIKSFPRVDSYKLPSMTIPDNGGTMYTGKLTIRDLDNFNIQSLRASESDLSMSVELNFPQLNVESDYKLEWIFSTDVGKMRVIIKDVTVRINVKARPTAGGTSVQVSNVDCIIKKDNVKLYLSGSYAWITNIAESTLRNTLENRIPVEGKNINDRIKENLSEIVNSYLHNKDIKKIIKEVYNYGH